MDILRYELNKIFSRKLTWICIFLLCALAFAMWSGGDSVITPEGVELRGREEIEFNKEVGRQYAGELTAQKAYDIMTTQGPGISGVDEERLQYYRQPLMDAIHFLFSGVEEKIFSVGAWGFISTEEYKSNKEAYIQGVEQAYQEMKAEGQSIRLGYSEGWERLLYLTTQGMMFAGAMAAILLAGIFADEYTRGTDALILTARYGRKRVAAMKVLAGFLAAAGIFLIYLLCSVVRVFLTYGTEGWDTSVQISSMGVYSYSPLAINYLQAFLLAVALWMMSMLMVAAMTMLVSVWSKSSFISVVVAETIYFLPAIVSAVLPDWLLSITPIGMNSVTPIIADNTVFGDAVVPIPVWCFMTGAFVLALSWILCRRSFSRHQVS